jgi:hypothetical protein
MMAIRESEDLAAAAAPKKSLEVVGEGQRPESEDGMSAFRRGRKRDRSGAATGGGYQPVRQIEGKERRIRGSAYDRPVSPVRFLAPNACRPGFQRAGRRSRRSCRE